MRVKISASVVIVGLLSTVSARAISITETLGVRGGGMLPSQPVTQQVVKAETQRLEAKLKTLSEGSEEWIETKLASIVVASQEAPESVEGQMKEFFAKQAKAIETKRAAAPLGTAEYTQLSLELALAKLKLSPDSQLHQNEVKDQEEELAERKRHEALKLQKAELEKERDRFTQDLNSAKYDSFDYHMALANIHHIDAQLDPGASKVFLEQEAESRKKAELAKTREARERELEAQRPAFEQQLQDLTNQLWGVTYYTAEYYNIQAEIESIRAKLYPDSSDYYMAEMERYRALADDEAKRQVDRECQRQLGELEHERNQHDPNSSEWYRLEALRLTKHAEFYENEREENLNAAQAAQRKSTELKAQEIAEAAARAEAERRVNELANVGAFSAELKQKIQAIQGFDRPLEVRLAARWDDVIDEVGTRRAVTEAFWQKITKLAEGQQVEAGTHKYLNVFKLLNASDGLPPLVVGNDQIFDVEWDQLQQKLIAQFGRFGLGAAEDYVQTSDGSVAITDAVKAFMQKLMQFDGQQRFYRNRLKVVLEYIQRLNPAEATDKDVAEKILGSITENSQRCLDRALSGLDNAELFVRIGANPSSERLLQGLILGWKKAMLNEAGVRHYRVDEHGNDLRFKVNAQGNFVNRWGGEIQAYNLAEEGVPDPRGSKVPEGETVEQYLFLVSYFNKVLGLGIPAGTQMRYSVCGNKRRLDEALQAFLNTVDIVAIVDYVDNQSLWKSIQEKEDKRLKDEFNDLSATIDDAFQDGANWTDGALKANLQAFAATPFFKEVQKAVQDPANMDVDKVKKLAVVNAIATQTKPANWEEAKDTWTDMQYADFIIAFDEFRKEQLRGMTRRLILEVYGVAGSPFAGLTNGQVAEMQEVIRQYEADPYEQSSEDRIRNLERKLYEKQTELTQLVQPIQDEIDRLEHLANSWALLRELANANDNLSTVLAQTDVDAGILVFLRLERDEAQTRVNEVPQRQQELAQVRQRLQSNATIQQLRGEISNIERDLQRLRSRR